MDPAKPLTNRATTVLSAGAGALALAAIAVALANAEGEFPGLAALANATTIVALVAVGIYAWRREPANRFGRLMVIAGYGWFLVSLGASDSSLPYSVGRVAAWPLEILVVYLFLIFPFGRLSGTASRGVMGLLIAIVATLYLPSALLVEHYPAPGAYSLCTTGCPENAFMLVASEPGLVEGVMRPIRELLTGIGFFAVTAVLAHRVLIATAAMRRTLLPVLVAACVNTLLMVFVLIARSADTVGERGLELAVGFRSLTIPIAALGFFVGLLSWRLHEARALEQLALQSTRVESPDELQGLLAGTLGDDSLTISYCLGGVWRDSFGNPTAAPVHNSDRCIVEVLDRDGEVLAVIECDRALSRHRGMVEASGAWIRNAVERGRLDAALAASLHDVEASRRRLATAAAGERRRIERDLHDGAQQQLVTLRVRLELAGEELSRDPEAGASRLRELGPSIDAVIEEVRALAGGIYPALLADAGLAEALRSVAVRNAIPVELDLEEGSRFPLEVESAVYFCCLEALQNASKHSGAQSISITVRQENGELLFLVSDDGAGFDPRARNGDGPVLAGAGLTNMHDRLAALGGRIEIDSMIGRGTRVRGRVPIAEGIRVG